MSKRWHVTLPILAAFASALILGYVVLLTSNTREQVLRDGVLEFNYVQQADHNLDALSLALQDYLIQRIGGADPVSKSEYMLRYDILYSGSQLTGPRWLGNMADNAQALQLQADIHDFVMRIEPDMHTDVQLDVKTARSYAIQARDLSDRIYQMGVELYRQRSAQSDETEARIKRLTKWTGVFGASFLVSTLLAVWMLMRSMKRAAQLSNEASATQEQLNTALQEVSSGDSERRAQTRFIAAASHDLRQPLHALGLYLSSLERHVESSEGKGILTNISRSTSALNELLGSLLDISKLDAGVVGVNRQNFYLPPLLVQLQDAFQPDAEIKDLEVLVDTDDHWVSTDRLLLERILANLLGNAIKYTDSGTITIRSEQHGESQIRLSVIDTGKGIPDSEQQAIFEEYYQLDNPERDRSKGLGLGLSIVHRLARLLGMELTLESSPGGGSRFSLLIEQGETEKPARLAGEDEEEPASRDGLRNLEVLVIDDEQDVREGMQSMLQSHGARVVVADSADSARIQLVERDFIPDVIVADYRLRDQQTGDAAIEQIREECNREVPALIVTGDTSPARLREAKASGHVLLHKPVAVEELVLQITRLAGRH